MRFDVVATESITEVCTDIVVKFEGKVIAELSVYRSGTVYVDKADCVTIKRDRIYSAKDKQVDNIVWHDVEFRPVRA